MSDVETTTNPPPDGNSFPSLIKLRSAHSELLKLHREHGDEPEILAEIKQLMHKGQATGALLDNEDDRWAAQSLLDYWSSLLYRAGEETPDATLAEFDSSLAPELDDGLCPYLGLEAFREENQQLFFGRQRLLNQLLQKLEHSNLLTVVGSSGSGKSSVVLGGLIPKLKARRLSESENWHYYKPIVPGSKPLESLARVVRPQGVDPIEWNDQQVSEFESNSAHLSDLIRELHDQQSVVLVVDQFEELFTLCQDIETVQLFVDNLLNLTRIPRKTHIVILTMRTDFEDRITRLRDFQKLFEEAQVRVTALDAGELRDAIEKPAELVGLKFENGLIEELLEDVLGENAALPLLQFTLLKLWENRERNRVTWESYKRVGSGRESLARSANNFYTCLIPEDQQTAKRILLKMVRPTEGLEVTSNRILKRHLYDSGEAADRIDRVLEKLDESRLIRYTRGDSPDDTQVEIAHEALIRNWDRLINWIEEERHFLRQRRRLTDDAERWLSRGKKEDFLYRGEQTKEAQRYDDLSDLEKEFIYRSLEEEKNQQTRELQSRTNILENRVSYAYQAVEEPLSVANLGEILERLNTRTLTDSDTQLLYRLLQRNTRQNISPLGKFNLIIEENSNIQVSDRYTGLTPEHIRLIVREVVQELESLQPTHSDLALNSEENPDDSLLEGGILDSAAVAAINVKLEIIKEISEAGYLPVIYQNELRQLKQRIQSLRRFNEDLRQLSEQGDQLIQSSIAAMQLQIDALKLVGRQFTQDAQTQSSQTELDCQQREAQIFQSFTNRLENTRLGADWIERNMEALIEYASSKVLEQFPNLNISEEVVDDFKFSLKQFLEQVNFCLYWGSSDILDDPNIPLVFGIEQYKVAFQAVKNRISKQLRTETFQEVQICLDYLIECLQFY